MSELLVDIHVPARSAGIPDVRYIDDGLAKWGRPELALALYERGVEPVFSRGPDAYDFVRGEAAILRPAIEMTGNGYKVTATPASVAVGSIHAIRNITRTLGNGAPELNHPIVRETARDKLATNAILDTIGLSKAYAAWDKDMPIDLALDGVPADRVVLKPRKGMRSRDIRFGTKAEIARIANAEIPEDGTEWIIEEEVGFTPPLELRGLDAGQQELIDTVNDRRMPKELRAYSFGRDEAGDSVTMYVLRAAQLVTSHLSDDKWVFIDQDSVPEVVREKTESVLMAFEQATGVREMHVAVDWGLVTRQGQSEPEYLPTEVNGTEPQLIYRSDHPEVAAQQAGMLADQLERIAQKRSTL